MTVIPVYTKRGTRYQRGRGTLSTIDETDIIILLMNVTFNHLGIFNFLFPGTLRGVIIVAEIYLQEAI